MRKFILLLLAAAMLTISCSTILMSGNVRKLEIGMTKTETVRIMGRNYSVVFSDAYRTVWGYVNPDPSSRERYILSFDGDRLAMIETVLEPVLP